MTAAASADDLAPKSALAADVDAAGVALLDGAAVDAAAPPPNMESAGLDVLVAVVDDWFVLPNKPLAVDVVEGVVVEVVGAADLLPNKALGVVAAGVAAAAVPDVSAVFVPNNELAEPVVPAVAPVAPDVESALFPNIFPADGPVEAWAFPNRLDGAAEEDVSEVVGLAAAAPNIAAADVPVVDEG